MKMPNLRNTAIGLGATAMASGVLYKPETPENGPWERREAAAEELRDHGITEEQRQAYALGISEVLHRGITPFGNEKNIIPLLQEIPHNLLWSRFVPHEIRHGSSIPENEEEYHVREDGFCLYLGMPQRYGSFEISRYRPATSEEDTYYYAVKDWFKNLFEKVTQDRNEWERITQTSDADKETISSLRSLVEACESAQENSITISALLSGLYTAMDAKSHSSLDYWSKFVDTLDALHTPVWLVEGTAQDGIIIMDNQQLGHVKVSLGRDAHGEYLSYYDRFDFGQPGQQVEKVVDVSTRIVGKPFEIYDRVYFDRQSWSVMAPVAH